MASAGKSDAEARRSKKSKLAESSLLEWSPLNERIIKARFHSKFIKLTFVQVYAPTMETEEEEIDQF